MNLKVVEVNKIDLPLLQEIVKHEEVVFGRGGLNEWTLPMVVRYGKVFILVKGKELAGVAELMKDWKESGLAFLIGFSIKKEHRQKGLGEFFLKNLIDLLKQDKVQKIQLTVSPSNTPALKLYEKFLFYQVDYNKDEYGKGEDRIFLELDLEKLKNGE